MASHRTDVHRVAFDLDVAEVGCEVIDVDDVLGVRKAKPHHRDQAMSASHEASLGTQAFEEANGVVDGLSSFVFERRRNLHSGTSFSGRRRGTAHRCAGGHTFAGPSLGSIALKRCLKSLLTLRLEGDDQDDDDEHDQSDDRNRDKPLEDRATSDVEQVENFLVIVVA